MDSNDDTMILTNISKFLNMIKIDYTKILNSVYCKASVNMISVSLIFEITRFW